MMTSEVSILQIKILQLQTFYSESGKAPKMSLNRFDLAPIVRLM